MINLLGSYRSGRAAVALVVIIALLTPAVTVVCEMTGLTTKSVPMTMVMSMSHHDDAPPRHHNSRHLGDPVACDDEKACGSSSACDSEPTETDACFLSYPGMEEGLVSSSQEPTFLPVVDLLDRPVQTSHLASSSPVSLERSGPSARHRPVALHLSHSSFLL